MPRLAEMQQLNSEQVISYLCILTNSQYAGVEEKRLADFLQPGEARRYLYSLIVRNTEKKADFFLIKELSQKNEYSDGKSYDSSLKNNLIGRVGKSVVISEELGSNGSVARRNHDAGVPSMIACSSSDSSREPQVSSMIRIHRPDSEDLVARVNPRSLSHSLIIVDNAIDVSEHVNQSVEQIEDYSSLKLSWETHSSVLV